MSAAYQAQAVVFVGFCMFIVCLSRFVVVFIFNKGQFISLHCFTKAIHLFAVVWLQNRLKLMTVIFT